MEINELREKAVSGDAAAKYDLAIAYINGDGVEADEEKSIALLAEAAAAGHPQAMHDYASCLLDASNGVPQDQKAGMELLMRAAEAGNADAQCDLALSYDHGDDGLEEDHGKALFWMEKAARQDDMFSQGQLAIMFSNPQEGIKPDDEQARYWSAKAAQQGDAYSMKLLGCYCVNDWEKSRSDEDFTKAEKWLSMAVAADEYSACCVLGDAYAERGHAGDAEKAEALYRQGAEANYVRPAYQLAQMLLADGRTPGDCEEGHKWLEFAAENGEADAMHKLSICYRDGVCGYPADRAQHFKWLKAECENDGYAAAWFLLADAYNNGDGTPKDDEQAFIWYKKAADAGNSYACGIMTEFYARGVGTAQDMEQARAYLARLRELGEYDAKQMSACETLLPLWEKEGCANAHTDDPDAQEKYAISIINLDAAKAIGILERCGEAGHAGSLIDLYQIFIDGFPNDGSLIPADQSRANYWLEKAAAFKGEWAYKRLANNYDNGQNGYPVDEEKAYYWWNRLLQQEPNSPDAQVLVGIRYLDGCGVAQDMERGIMLVRKSAQAGLGYGQYIYGRIYHYGGGSINKDLKQAEHWMSEAVKNGWENAAGELDEVRRELAEQGGGVAGTRNFCSRCGAPLAQGAHFCTGCGAQVGTAPEDKKGKKKGKYNGKWNGIVPFIFCILTLMTTLSLSDAPMRLMIFISVPVFIWTLITKLRKPVGTKKLYFGLLFSGIAMAISLIDILLFEGVI